MQDKPTNGRLESLDALRGFDMLWIMGGEELLCCLAALCGIANFPQLLNHVEWEGLHFMDTIFPTFLFMAGASFPFSCAKSRERGLTRGQIAWRAVRRGLTLMALGIIYWGFLLRLDFATFRIPSVLGYIGFGWMVAALIYLFVRKTAVRLAIAIAILAAVTLFFGFVPAPDATAVLARISGGYAALGAGVFTPSGNFGCYLDRMLLGPHLLHPNFMDNEGIAGLLPAVVTAMLGMFAGDIVRRGGLAATGRKVLALLGCAALCLVTGLTLSAFYPIIKKLWSPSFVLTVGAYSFALFAFFYWLIDVKGQSRAFFFFKVIGMNSITIYLAQSIINFHGATEFFLGGFAKLLPAGWGELVMSIGYIAACWLFLLFLYRKKVFLKV